MCQYSGGYRQGIESLTCHPGGCQIIPYCKFIRHHHKTNTLIFELILKKMKDYLSIFCFNDMMSSVAFLACRDIFVKEDNIWQTIALVSGSWHNNIISGTLMYSYESTLYHITRVIRCYFILLQPSATYWYIVMLAHYLTRQSSHSTYLSRPIWMYWCLASQYR